MKKRDVKKKSIFLLVCIASVFILLAYMFIIHQDKNMAEKGELKSIKPSFDDCPRDLISPENIIPRVQSYSLMSCDSVAVDFSWKIYADLSDYDDNFTAYYLQSNILKNTSVSLMVDNLDNIRSDKRIIIGNIENPVVRQIAVANGIDYNAEIKKGFGQGYILKIDKDQILIFGNTTSGTFYGAISLIWLLKNSGSQIILPNVKINDWPDLRIRGYLWGGSGMTSEDYLEYLAKLKYNLWIGGPRIFYYSNEQEKNYYLWWNQDFIKKRHFFSFTNVYPTEIFDIHSYTNEQIRNYHEGSTAKNISVIFLENNTGIVNEKKPEFFNSDFELDADSNNFPDGFYRYNGTTGVGEWKRDCANALDGGCCLNITIPANGAVGDYLYTQMMNITPERTYLLSFYAKRNEPIINNSHPRLGVYLFSEYGNWTSKLTKYTWVTDNSNTWKKYNLFFTTYNNLSYFSFFGIVDRTNKLDLWIDNMTLYDVSASFKNILNTNLSRLRVYNEDRNLLLEEGRDYYLGYSGNFNSHDFNTKQTIINRIPGGRIPENGKISADFDFVIFPGNWPSMSEPDVFDILNRIAAEPRFNNFNPDYVFVNFDEIRGMNKDSRSLNRNLSNYQVYSEFVSNYLKMIRRYSKVPIMTWDDMQNPFHNGGLEDYQFSYGGQSGKTWYSLDLLDRSFIQVSWAYDPFDVGYKMANSPNLYNKYGFKWIAGPWENNTNTLWWSFLSYKYDALGLIGHEFNGLNRGILMNANYSWNAVKTNPGIEICDGIDNDGDGEYIQINWVTKFSSDFIDEGFDLTSDPFNCGSCENICYFPRAYSSCFNGACKFEGCFEGYEDRDGNLANGCECLINGKCSSVPFCGDNLCQTNENCTNCAVDCGRCICEDCYDNRTIEKPFNKTCVSKYECSWSNCIDKKQENICIDLNGCKEPYVFETADCTGGIFVGEPELPKIKLNDNKKILISYAFFIFVIAICIGIIMILLKLIEKFILRADLRNPNFKLA